MRQLCLLYCLILPFSAIAQYNIYSEEPKTFTGSLVVGGNFTQIDGDSYYGYQKPGLNLGAQVYTHFNESFGVSLDLMYSQKGSRGQNIVQSPYIGTYVTKYHMNVNYVEVPVLLHYIVRNMDWEAGASYSYLVGSDEWILTDQPVAISAERNSFNTTDFNWVLGVSRKLYKNLFANFRFQYSITSIRPFEKIPIGYSYGQNGQFNNLLSLRLAYVF